MSAEAQDVEDMSEAEVEGWRELIWPMFQRMKEQGFKMVSVERLDGEKCRVRMHHKKKEDA